MPAATPAWSCSELRRAKRCLFAFSCDELTRLPGIESSDNTVKVSAMLSAVLTGTIESRALIRMLSVIASDQPWSSGTQSYDRSARRAGREQCALLFPLIVIKCQSFENAIKTDNGA